MPTVVALTPAIVGEAVVGHSRVGVYTDRWEQQFCALGGAYRALTRRIAAFPSAESTTGIRFPVFTDETIYGVAIERGRAMPPLAAAFGVRQSLDLTVLTLYPCNLKDHVYDGLNSREYEVGGVERHNDPQVYYDGSGNELVSLAFYAVHCRLVEEKSQLGGL